MAKVALEHDIKEDGVWQGDLVKFQNNVLDLINELQADHATQKVTTDEIKTLIDELHDDAATNRTELLAIGTSLGDFKTIFDAHTHTQQDGDSAQSSIPDDTAAGITQAGTAVVFTDTSGSPAATLTALKPTAGPATLTNATALVLTKG